MDMMTNSFWTGFVGASDSIGILPISSFQDQPCSSNLHLVGSFQFRVKQDFAMNRFQFSLTHGKTIESSLLLDVWKRNKNN